MVEYLDINERIRMALHLGESHFREFKSAVDRSTQVEKPRDVKGIMRDIGETVVAFANADGGELIVGIEDDGSITGVPHGDEDVERMMQAPETHVLADTPLPNPRTYKLPLSGKLAGKGQILYFSVPKGTQFVYLTAAGRCLQRHDRETRPVPAELIQYQRQEQRSRECDREFIDSANMEHLDLSVLEMVAQELMPGVSPEKILQYLDLAEYLPGGLRLRRAAALLFGKDITRWHPRCQVRVVRVAGTDLATGKEYKVIRDDVVRGNVLELLETAWYTLRRYLAVTRLGAGGLFEESLMYPEYACREALVNAIAHRDYSMEGSGIEILIFDDRMEVQSPGGLLSTISVDELKRLTGVHQSRNPYITRVLRERYYMRELGEGIPRIFRTMEEHNFATPDISSEAGTFTIALYNRSIFSQRDQEWLQSYKDFDLSTDEERVLLLGKDGHLIAPREIRTTLKIIDTEDYRIIVEKLQRKGLMYSVMPSARATGAAKRARRSRRDIGRFALRPLGEVDHFYRELVKSLRELPHTNRITYTELRWLCSRLSPRSPYGSSTGDLLKSLTYVGFIDPERRPLPQLESLWKRRS